MRNISKIFTVIYAGVIPIILCVVYLFNVAKYFLYDEYIASSLSFIFQLDLVVLLSALVLSVSNNYCRYHSMMIISLSYCCILSLIHDKFLTLFGDYLVYNLIILSLTMFSLIMLIVVFVHIARQIKKHIHKLKLLYYGIQQRIFRCYRRNS